MHISTHAGNVSDVLGINKVIYCNMETQILFRSRRVEAKCLPKTDFMTRVHAGVYRRRFRKEIEGFIWDKLFFFSGMTNQNNSPFHNGTSCNLETHIHNKHQNFHLLINFKPIFAQARIKTLPVHTTKRQATAVLITSFGLAYREKVNHLKLGYVT